MHSSFGHLGSPHSLAILDNAAINNGCMYPLKSVVLHPRSKDRPREGEDGKEGEDVRGGSGRGGFTQAEISSWHSPFSMETHAVLQGNRFRVQIWKLRLHKAR